MEKLIDTEFVPGKIYNVNFPFCPLSDCKGVLYAREVSRGMVYKDGYKEVEKLEQTESEILFIYDLISMNSIDKAIEKAEVIPPRPTGNYSKSAHDYSATISVADIRAKSNHVIRAKSNHVMPGADGAGD